MNVNELMYDLEECKLEVESVLWEIFMEVIIGSCLRGGWS